MEEKIDYLEEKLIELSVIVANIAEANTNKELLTTEILTKLNDSVKNLNNDIKTLVTNIKKIELKLEAIESEKNKN